MEKWSLSEVGAKKSSRVRQILARNLPENSSLANMGRFAKNVSRRITNCYFHLRGNIQLNSSPCIPQLPWSLLLHPDIYWNSIDDIRPEVANTRMSESV